MVTAMLDECERCNEPISDDELVVDADEISTEPVGLSRADGLGVRFHKRCWYPSPRYLKTD